MAAPQVLKPGHPDQLLVAAAAALFLAAAVVWHGTLSSAQTAPATRSDTVGATSSFEAVRAVVNRAAEREAARRDSVLAPVPDPAVMQAATTASAVLEPADIPLPQASAAAGAGAGALVKPSSPTLFDGGSAADRTVSWGRESLATAVHSTATPELGTGDRVVATVSFYYCTEDAGPVGDGGSWCGAMRDGTTVYPGAAACDFQYLGQQFRIEGDPTDRVYTCNDTGSAVRGLHRDIWFHTNAEGWDWQRDVGRQVVIEIVN